MTYREFYSAVANLTAEDNAELNEFACKAIEALDHKNELRKGRESKEKKETSARKASVLDFLTENEGTFSRNEIAVALGITDGQATSACTALVKEGLVTKSEIKVDKAKKMVYTIA